MQSLTSTEIEIYLSNYFNYRQNTIIPNISYGLGVHECDLFVIRKSGYVVEIEIKISVQDIKADLKKEHKHKSKKIRELYFAIPKELEHAIKYIPEHAGIITIEKHLDFKPATIRTIRSAKLNTDARKLTTEEIQKAGHLGCMRIWALKQQVVELSRQIKTLKANAEQ